MRQWPGIKALLGIMVFALFASAQPAAAAAAPAALIISAAASLTNVMQALGKDFEKQYPRVTLSFNFGATGNLLAQMSQGAPVDIFASASVKHMDQAQEKGLIVPESRRTFAGNTLVLAKPATTTIPLSGLADLTSPQVERIAIGKPETVPAGQYAKETLVTAGLWNVLAGKLIFGSSVRQVLDYLRRGEVDAGLIYATDAKIAEAQVTVITALPGSLILYPVALAKTSQHRKAATMFLDYLGTAAARTILAEHGFSLP